MSRGDGFPIADVDVGILDDPKVRALVRVTRDEATITRCLTAYWAVLMASWGRGERVALEDATPLWITGIEDLKERLVTVGLLDTEGRIPERSWAGWFGPAHDRRQHYRELGSKGGRASHSSVERTVERTVEPVRTVRSFLPVVPSVDARDPLKRDETTCPGCGDLVLEGDPNVVVVDKLGRYGHRICPGRAA